MMNLMSLLFVYRSNLDYPAMNNSLSVRSRLIVDTLLKQANTKLRGYRDYRHNLLLFL